MQTNHVQNNLSVSIQQQQQYLFANNQHAREITQLNDYGDVADVYNHRDKLNNTLIENFKLQRSFYSEFATDKPSSLELRNLLYFFVSKETSNICSAYDNIRDAVCQFFSKINNKMQNTSEGYFWRQKFKTMSNQRQVGIQSNENFIKSYVSLVTRGLEPGCCWISRENGDF